MTSHGALIHRHPHYQTHTGQRKHVSSHAAQSNEKKIANLDKVCFDAIAFACLIPIEHLTRRTFTMYGKGTFLISLLILMNGVPSDLDHDVAATILQMKS